MQTLSDFLAPFCPADLLAGMRAEILSTLTPTWGMASCIPMGASPAGPHTRGDWGCPGELQEQGKDPQAAPRWGTAGCPPCIPSPGPDPRCA